MPSNKDSFKIKKGYSKMTDFLTKKVYVRFPNLHLDLQSLNSFYNYGLMCMAKRGIQCTASTYEEDDIWDYLSTNYNVNKDLKYLKSFSTMTYTLNNVAMLKYAALNADSKDLKKDLTLLANTCELKENIRAIEDLFVDVSDNSSPRTISPSAYIRNGHIFFRPRYDVTRSVIVELAGETKVEKTYYTGVYYDQLSYILGDMFEHSPKDDITTWTFLKGLTREEEAPYLKDILYGNIEATSMYGKKIQLKYFKLQSDRGENFLFLDTLEKRRSMLDWLYENFKSRNIDIKGLNDYCVYYKRKSKEEASNLTNSKEIESGVKPRHKRVKHNVIVLTGYYVYDYDNKTMLKNPINRILGITGEFSRKPEYEGQYPYDLINDDGEFEYFYRVNKTEDLVLDDLKQNPVQFNGFASDLTDSLVASDNLSTDLEKLKRVEKTKYYQQIPNYWDENQRYLNNTTR